MCVWTHRKYTENRRTHIDVEMMRKTFDPLNFYAPININIIAVVVDTQQIPPQNKWQEALKCGIHELNQMRPSSRDRLIDRPTDRPTDQLNFKKKKPKLNNKWNGKITFDKTAKSFS